MPQAEKSFKHLVDKPHYSVPEHLEGHIDFITPGVHVSSFTKRNLHKRSLQQLEERAASYDDNSTANCGSHIRPPCIKALYNIPDATLNTPENALGIYEDFQSYDQIDLNLNFRRFLPYIPQGTHPKLVDINDAPAPGSVKNASGEAVLDFYLAYALTYPQTLTLYQANPTVKQAERWANNAVGSKANAFDYFQSLSVFELLLDAVDGSYCSKKDKADGADCGTAELTRVLSVSYAASELFLPEKLASRACSEYMKLG